MSALIPVRNSGKMSQIQPGSMPEARIDEPPSWHAARIGSASAGGVEGG